MTKAIIAGLAACGLVGAGCASAPVQSANGMASRSYHAASDASGQISNGFASAAETPLKDFNLIRQEIPQALRDAEARPYAADGLDTCDAIRTQIAALDLELGPDLDSPSSFTDHYHRGAAFAADTALDGLKDVTEGVIPMRSWVKRLSGRTRAEEAARRAILAGSVRRGFLKALGMSHNCAWPAAPMSFQPAQVAVGPTMPPPPEPASLRPAGPPVAPPSAPQTPGVR